MGSTQYVGRSGGTRWSAFFSSVLATSVAMETWPVEHHVFVYDAFVKYVLWPPRLPDLSCYFFLWGYLKSHVYIHKPRTLNDLKEAIQQEIRPIDRLLLARVMDDLKKKGLKTALKKTVVILSISFLKLNHLVWHVLSFNFV